MTHPSRVRIAGPEDHQEIWRLFLAVFKDNGLLPLSPQRVEWVIQRFLNSDLLPEEDMGPRGIIGVIGPVGSIEAMVFLHIGGAWYSDARALEELTPILVDPEHRKSDHAKALMAWMRKQAEALDLPFMAGVVNTPKTEQLCRLYRRMMPKAGEFFYVPAKGSKIADAPALEQIVNG